MALHDVVPPGQCLVSFATRAWEAPAWSAHSHRCIEAQSVTHGAQLRTTCVANSSATTTMSRLRAHMRPPTGTTYRCCGVPEDECLPPVVLDPTRLPKPSPARLSLSTFGTATLRGSYTSWPGYQRRAAPGICDPIDRDSSADLNLGIVTRTPGVFVKRVRRLSHNNQKDAEIEIV